MLTVLSDVTTFRLEVEAGCDAYLIKPFSDAQLLETLTCCRLHASSTTVIVSADSLCQSLDPRETAVAEFVSQGLTDKEIAERGQKGVSS